MILPEGNDPNILAFAHLSLKSIREIGYPIMLVTDKELQPIQERINSMGLGDQVDLYVNYSDLTQQEISQFRVIDYFSLVTAFGFSLLNLIGPTNGDRK